MWRGNINLLEVENKPGKDSGIPQTESYDITEWHRKDWLGFYGGKRRKGYFENPEGQQYFFKESHIRYPWEFWCEIIASKLGQMLKIPVLNYDLALYHDVQTGEDIWGCISQIINKEGEQLVHGQQMLLAIKPNFDTQKGTDHSYQLVKKALANYDKLMYLSNIQQIIAFDALICNRDRHQENWGILMNVSGLKPKIPFTRLPFATNFRNFIQGYFGLKIKLRLQELLRLPIPHRFAPIYDNGSSLGHNLIPSKLHLYTEDKDADKRILNYGTGKHATAHIRWHEKKLTHDDLIIKLLKEKESKIGEHITKMLSNLNEDRLELLLTKIDKHWPQSGVESTLTDQRKTFIRKLILLRAEKLRQLIQ